MSSSSTNQDKIIIISPAFPFRGGIAATSDRLAKEYVNRGEKVEIWTYKILYPKFIFPGKSQYLDPANHKAPEEYPIHRKIVSINPLNWLKVGRQLKKEQAKKVIIRYWLPFLAPCLGTIASITKRNKKTKIIGLIDNVSPHESRFGDKFLSTYFYKKLDGFLVMAEKGAKELKEIFMMKQKIIYSPHPLFDIYGDRISKQEAADFLKLNPENNYILSFGLIRKYKGIDLLIDAFATFSNNHPNYRLLIVGECYDDWKIYQDLIDKNGLNDKIIRFDNFVPDNEVNNYFSVSDFLALTYKSATQSGVTQIAYSMELPILVTNVGDLPNMVPHNEVGLVCESNVAAIASHLNEMVEGENLEKFQMGIREEKSRFEWSVLCDNIDRF